MVSDAHARCRDCDGKSGIGHGVLGHLVMNQFPAGIISNGSFSWWSAWLGREKRVIAPKVWFTGLDYRDCVPERWERL